MGKTLPKAMVDLAHTATYVYPAAGEEELQPDQELDEDTSGSSEGASRFFLKNDGVVLPIVGSSAVRLYLHSAQTSKKRPAKVYDEVPSELIDFLVATYYKNDCTLSDPKYADLEFVSEYTRGESTFRGHWNYRSNGPWNDWAYVNWAGGEGLVPAKILMFAKYTTPCASNDSAVCDEDPYVVYEAIIISGKDRPKLNTLLTMKFELDMRYQSVDCMAISEHCLVFPNDGAHEHSMIVVSPIQEWSDKFLPISM